ncbi:MAG: transposase [Candidatus Cloacimonetes bacterium]|nr:transposase [Candidatus Cloacimonadota bacterium]
MRDRYKVVEKDRIHLITSTIVEWIPVFNSDKYFRILVDSIKFCQYQKELKVFFYVIMDNHFHLITSSENLSQTIASLKRFVALKLVEIIKADNKFWLLEQLGRYKKAYKQESNYQVWQEGFHPQLISSYKMLDQKVMYIHQNPVRRGLVNEPEHWKYSSACNRDFEGTQIIELDEIPF